MSNVRCNPTLRDIHAIVNATENPWVNPLGNSIDLIFAEATDNRIPEVTQMIADLDPQDPNYTQDLADLNELLTALKHVNETEGTELALSRSQDYSQFLSGRDQSFPSSLLSMSGEVPKIALAATMTFTSVLTLSGNAKEMAAELCEPDPEDPCEAILGIFSFILSQAQALIQQLLDWLSNTWLAQGIRALIDAINNLLGAIFTALVDSLTALANMIEKALNMVLSKLLDILRLDPCVQQVLGTIAGNSLKGALGIPV